MDKPKLLEWLNSPCLPEDLLPLPWDSSKLYMPIEVVRKKHDIMRTEFNAIIEQVDLSFNVVPLLDKNKDTVMWAYTKHIVKHSEFDGGQTIVLGVASILMGGYKGWSFAQICESLATTRGFSKEWAQFGRDINKDLESLSYFNPIKGKGNSAAVDNSLKKFT